ncbi:fused MFS/spermidine synthase [Agrobacterium tumefaciens]|uniref:fused MFS/spermidine synthase n=1 Tax=Agrobacterium tumefaciens TaxID=358 RepID=UPI0004595942|nr:fused MFS/spermidine synthase [Agrobacterium tumefaciens]CDN96482.1 hypothetical protein BN949_05661 [Agrobacterium tumefaciens]
MDYLSKSIVLVVAFFVGFLIMGFEMLASRYLYPYLGGSTATWGGLIAVALAALTIGYFLGGTLADRIPTRRTLAVTLLVPSLILFSIPLWIDAVLTGLIQWDVNDLLLTLTCSMVLLFLPLTLYGACSPFFVKLLLEGDNTAGRLVGVISAVSTLGSVTGTLLTTFIFIPSAGSREVTLGLAALGIVVVLLLLIDDWRTRT